MAPLTNSKRAMAQTIFSVRNNYHLVARGYLFSAQATYSERLVFLVGDQK